MSLVSDPKLAVGKLFALWVDFAKFYEKNQQINDARIIFEKATHVAYLKVDDLANVWCEWVEMELRWSIFFCRTIVFDFFHAFWNGIPFAVV